MVCAVSSKQLRCPRGLKDKRASHSVTRWPVILAHRSPHSLQGLKFSTQILSYHYISKDSPWENPGHGLTPLTLPKEWGLPPSQQSLGVREMQSQNFTSALPRSSPGRESVLLLIRRSFRSRR